MKNIIVSALVTLAVIPAFGRIKLGEAIPSESIKMMSTQDKNVTLAEISKGKKGTLVVFSCNHCPYAKAWESRIAAIGADAQQKGFGVVMINSNDPTDYPEDSMEGMKKKKYAFPYVVDATSQVARSFGATKTPDVFLFDAQGKLVYKGAVDDNSESEAKVKEHYLKDALAAILGGQKIAKAETKSVGCGIKFRN